VQVVRLAGFDLDRVDTTDLELDVDDWIARAEQSPDEARQVRELLADTVGTSQFGGHCPLHETLLPKNVCDTIVIITDLSTKDQAVTRAD
jgi:hypothetical protein